MGISICRPEHLTTLDRFNHWLITATPELLKNWVEQRFSAALNECDGAASAAEVPRGLNPTRAAICKPERLLHPPGSGHRRAEAGLRE